MLSSYYGYWAIWNEFHKVTFDGINKEILINDGVDAISVKEIYSSWKEWMLLYDNAKWEPAIRTVGGDQITNDAALGASFFLINGWRIRPYDRDHRLSVDGNIYTDPSGFSPFLLSVGSSQVLIESNVSALIYSTLAQQAEIEQSAFNDGVTIDTVNGTDGTTYPVGTPTIPVRTLAHALTIARARGFTKLYIKGHLVIGTGEDVQNFHIYGQGATLNVTRTRITFQTGSITSLAHFYDARVTGEQGGEGHFTNCIIAGISKSHCHFKDCGFVLPTTGDGLTSVPTYTIQHNSSLSSSHITDLHGCYSDENTVVIDRNGSGLSQLYTSFSGRIKFINQNKSSGQGSVWLHMNGGTVTIDPTCTRGSFFISGTCTVIDNSVGATVDTTGVTTPSTLSTAVWSNTTAVSIASTINADSVKLALLEKILRNKTVTDPATGLMTIYDVDGVTPLLVAPVFQDAAGTTPYQGTGADRRERLT